MPRLHEGWSRLHPAHQEAAIVPDDTGIACRVVRVAMVVYLSPVIATVLLVGGASAATIGLARAASRLFRGTRGATPTPRATLGGVETIQPHFVVSDRRRNRVVR